MYNWSIGVQRDIGWGTVVEASYVATRGRWLGEQRNINGVPDGARFVNCYMITTLNLGIPCRGENRDPFTALSGGGVATNPGTNVTTGARNNDFLRPYLGYGDINQVTWSANSRYDSLQVQVNRRYIGGFRYGVAYTFSKSQDTTSDDRDGLVFATGGTGRDYNSFNWAPSDYDQRHIFTVNYIWDVPIFRRGHGLLYKALGGWQLSGTTSFATGKPKDVSVSYSSTAVSVSNGQACPVGSFAGTAGATTTSCTPITDFTGGSVNALPFINCDDPNKGVTGSDPTGTPLYLSASCFVRPTKYGDVGNMPRNFGRRPNIFNSDIALFKNFQIGERHGLQLRWETYNVFNHTNFSDLDGGLAFGLVQINPSPGTACSATNICKAEFQQTNTRFGAPTSARSPRVMQASIRFNF